MVQRSRDTDSQADFRRRLGRSAQELGLSSSSSSCPDIWELDNGDFAIVGRDVTAAYSGRLPEGVSLAAGERLVVLPRAMVLAAKRDIPDV
jgi:hypothetical protein